MGREDQLMKLFFTNPYVFADVFNFWLYNGEERIKPEYLKETSGDLISLTEKWKKQESEIQQYLNGFVEAKPLSKKNLPQPDAIEKVRDSLMQLVCMDDGEFIYVLLGIEGQSYVDYGMAARALIYDALQINKQLDEIRREHIVKNERGSTDGEYLYRYFKTDYLTPVITVVVYLGKEEWDGPRTLREMYHIKDPVLLRESLDYKMKLIEPCHMSDEDIEKFQSNMREVLLFLRSAKDKKQLYKLAEENQFRDMDPVAAHLLNSITKSNLKFTNTTRKGKIQMCEAIKGIREDAIKEGIECGIEQNQREVTKRMAAQGISVPMISSFLNVAESVIESWLSQRTPDME